MRTVPREEGDDVRELDEDIAGRDTYFGTFGPGGCMAPIWRDAFR